MSHLDATATLRVILVGRTGLESALRRDPSIELIRARTALEALGELSEPIDSESPSDCVMVLGPDIESQVKPIEMAAAVRIIHAKCPILLAIDGEPADMGFDGVVHPDATAPALRELLSRVTLRPLTAEPSKRPFPFRKNDAAKSAQTQSFMVSSSPLPSSVEVIQSPDPLPPELPMQMVEVTPAAREPIVPRPIAPSRTESSPPTLPPPSMPMPARPAAAVPAPAPRPAPALASTSALIDLMGDPLSADLHIVHGAPVTGPTGAHLTSTTDDRDLVSAIMRGHNIVPIATELMRQRTGANDLVFHPVAPAPPIGATPVRLDGRLLGHIHAPTLAKHTLEDEAAWLAGWLVLREVYADTRRSALTDPLTGAYNRRYLDRFLPAAIDHARSHRHALSVLVLDIDNFKSFNDRYGHAAGDEILADTVKLLRSVVRDDDRICRSGGDEFVVVLYEPHGPRDPRSRHPASALALADRFTRAIATHKFPSLGKQAVGHLTVSGGLATFPWDGGSAADLLARADAALLEGKRAGKNIITVGKD